MHLDEIIVTNVLDALPAAGFAKYGLSQYQIEAPNASYIDAWFSSIFSFG
jgi:hypothetical protein